MISVVVSAPSGTGKTTIIKRLLELDDRFQFSISTTTRERRPDEKEGLHYYYISEESFLEKIRGKEFVEWARVYNNYYGTTKKEIDRIQSAGKIPIFDVDVQGARQLKCAIENAVFIFVLPPSLQDLRERLFTRNTDSPAQRELRLNNAVSELREYAMYDYIVVNKSIDDAIADIMAIVRAESRRTFRMEHIMNNWRGEIDNSTR